MSGNAFSSGHYGWRPFTCCHHVLTCHFAHLEKVPHVLHAHTETHPGAESCCFCHQPIPERWCASWPRTKINSRRLVFTPSVVCRHECQQLFLLSRPFCTVSLPQPSLRTALSLGVDESANFQFPYRTLDKLIQKVF